MFFKNSVKRERDLFKQANEVLRKRNGELRRDNIYLKNAKEQISDMYDKLNEEHYKLNDLYNTEKANSDLLEARLRLKENRYLILPKNEGQVKKEALKYIRYVTDDNKYIIEINTEYKVFCYEYRGNQKEQMLEDYNKLIEQL